MEKLIVDSNIFINSFNLESEYRDESVDFLSFLIETGRLITMPAHGLFEIQCSLKRLSSIDKKYIHRLILGETNYPIEVIHIDDNFISKYSNVEVPYIKAGDHLFLVIAKLNNYPLITRDRTLTSKAIEAKIDVYTPTEFMTL